MKKFFKILFSIIFNILLLAIGFLVGMAINIFAINKPKTEKLAKPGELNIHFLELGNNNTGDCIYIKSGDTDMLIDAGSKNNSASTINAYLDHYVEDGKLEYVVATHAHEDHIAAFFSKGTNEGVLAHFQVDTLIDFPLTNSDSTTYQNYVSTRDDLVANGTKHFTALECFNETNGASRVYSLSQNVEFEILYNYYYDHTQSAGENDYSVCLMLRQGDDQYLFTGDLEARGEKKLVEYYDTNFGGLGHCKLYKAGHHGSGTSTSDELLAAITPEVICVCCCAGTKEYTSNNDNQFPYQSFVDAVAPYTEKVYVTTVVDDYETSSVKSMNGNIVASITNGEMTLNFSNNDLILKETEWFKANRVCPQAWL